MEMQQNSEFIINNSLYREKFNQPPGRDFANLQQQQQQQQHRTALFEQGEISHDILDFSLEEEQKATSYFSMGDHVYDYDPNESFQDLNMINPLSFVAIESTGNTAIQLNFQDSFNNENGFLEIPNPVNNYQGNLLNIGENQNLFLSGTALLFDGDDIYTAFQDLMGIDGNDFQTIQEQEIMMLNNDNGNQNSSFSSSKTIVPIPSDQNVDANDFHTHPKTPIPKSESDAEHVPVLIQIDEGNYEFFSSLIL